MARKVFAVFGSLFFLVLAPGTIAGLVPWWISRWRLEPASLDVFPMRLVGALLIVAGIAVVLDSFVRFAIQGVGTPAPVFPTRRLVITGFYRFVRNPIYLAVVSVILGQSLVLGNMRLLAYGAVVWVAFHVFVLAYEEPTLRKTFGTEYEAYDAHVPRWLPRWSPWRPDTDQPRAK